MTDYKKGAILGSILGGLVYSISSLFIPFSYYIPPNIFPFFFFIGMGVGCLFGFLFSKLYDFFQCPWRAAGGTVFIIWFFIFIFVFGGTRSLETGLLYTYLPLGLMLPWSILMIYFWEREESEELNKSKELEGPEDSSRFWWLPLFGIPISAIIFGLVLRQVFYQGWYYYGKSGTLNLLFLALGVCLFASAVGSYLIYRKKEKQFNLEVLIYGGIIFMIAFSIFSGGMYQAGIFTRGSSTNIMPLSWDEAVCDAGMNVINSTVSNEGSKIPTDGGGTFLVKRDGRIVCEKNLSATDLGNGSLIYDEPRVWNQGETVSYNLDVKSSPYCDSEMTIESNQDYTLELKINERPRDTFKTACTGKHY